MSAARERVGHALLRARRRATAQRALRRVGWSAAALSPAVAVLVWRAGLGPGIAAWAAGTALTLGFSLWRRPSLAATARLVDAAHGLEARPQTAHDCAEDPRPVVELLMEDLARRLPSPGRELEGVLPRAWPALCTGAVLLALAVAVPAIWSPRAPGLRTSPAGAGSPAATPAAGTALAPPSGAPAAAGAPGTPPEGAAAAAPSGAQAPSDAAPAGAAPKPGGAAPGGTPTAAPGAAPEGAAAATLAAGGAAGDGAGSAVAAPTTAPGTPPPLPPRGEAGAALEIVAAAEASSTSRLPGGATPSSALLVAPARGMGQASRRLPLRYAPVVERYLSQGSKTH